MKMTKKTSKTIFFIFFLISPCIICTSDHHSKSAATTEKMKIRGMFVFGSSLVDNGNNNFLENPIARVNYFPYGVDFPLGHSGRFTNGKNVIDALGQKLQLPNYIPPFTDPSTNGTKIVNGVNFASGGSGILDDTGSLVKVISLNRQIRSFEEVTLPELKMQLGNRSSQEILARFLFVVGSGGNDYSLNYFMGLPKNNITIEVFTVNLITSLSHKLKRLHNLGARKFVLMALNPTGCSPVARTQQGCAQTANEAVQMFNAHLSFFLLRLLHPYRRHYSIGQYTLCASSHLTPSGSHRTHFTFTLTADFGSEPISFNTSIHSPKRANSSFQ